MLCRASSPAAFAALVLTLWFEPASSQAPAAPAAGVPKIPLCTGMTLVTAVNDATGDYESIKTLQSVDDKEIRVHYTTQKVDYGDMFSIEPPKVKTYESRRTILREDLRTSRSYLQEFASVIPELVPGMTSLGTSSQVLAELKSKGEAEFGISHWAFAVPPGLDRNDSQSIYRKQMVTRSKVLEKSVKVPVLVNGQPTELPAIHTRGDFLSYISEFWFLDQPDNPLTLKFRIGIGERRPLSAEEKKGCETAPKMNGFPSQHCLKPDGGDSSTLDLVKINYRCGPAAPPTGTGAGPGAGAASGGGSGLAQGTGSGGGAAGGALASAGAAQLETALAKENRVEIFDIFFAFNSDEIRKESEPRLADIAQVLKQHPDWKLRVEGHTDSIAQDDYNLKLSQRRAAAVKAALVSRYGIEAARLTPEGLGETRPRAQNDTLAGRARNRRVELVKVP
jgi:outer membrane protein OmpA-like peptidoglycan-associated protein